MSTTIRKKQLIYISIAVLVIVGLFVVFMLASSSQYQPVVAGQNIVVTVQADTLEDMYGYQFRINYNQDELEYTETLTSKIQNISNIFSKQKEEKEGYELVGATMVGEQSGITGKNKALCEMVFTAKKDGMLSDFSCLLSDIKVIKIVESELEDVDNIEGWQCKLSLQA